MDSLAALVRWEPTYHSCPILGNHLNMMGIARTIVAETYAPYEIFMSVMVIYLILTWLIQRSFGWTEKRLSRHVRSEV